MHFQDERLSVLLSGVSILAKSEKANPHLSVSYPRWGWKSVDITNFALHLLIRIFVAVAFVKRTTSSDRLMKKTKAHIIKSKRVVLVWLVLFSLAPCTIKEVLFQSVNIAYSKPLNKSQTTSNACQFTSRENYRFSFAKYSGQCKHVEPNDFLDRLRFADQTVKPLLAHAKTFSGTSPPKYILYKRLKIDAA